MTDKGCHPTNNEPLLNYLLNNLTIISPNISVGIRSVFLQSPVCTQLLAASIGLNIGVVVVVVGGCCVVM